MRMFFTNQEKPLTNEEVIKLFIIKELVGFFGDEMFKERFNPKEYINQKELK